MLAAIALQTFGFDIINSKLPILLTTEFARTAYSELLPHPELKNADGEFDTDDNFPSGSSDSATG